MSVEWRYLKNIFWWDGTIRESIALFLPKCAYISMLYVIETTSTDRPATLKLALSLCLRDGAWCTEQNDTSHVAKYQISTEWEELSTRRHVNMWHISGYILSSETRATDYGNRRSMVLIFFINGISNLLFIFPLACTAESARLSKNKWTLC